MIAEAELPLETRLRLARRQLALERRKLELLQENQIEFYNPHPKQRDFHSAAVYHFRYARTGNRFGKSEMGAAEDVAYALGYRPWIAEGDPARTVGIPRHPTKGLIVTTDWDKSTEIFTSQEDGPNLGKLFKYIPSSKVLGTTKNHSSAIDSIKVQHISGGVSVIHLDTVKSFKGNKLGVESSAWDWAHFDEPLPEAMFKGIVRGMIDRGGRFWFTCTPLEEPWIDELFVPDTEMQTRNDLKIQHGDFWMMTGATSDNPHNKSEDIDRIMSLYTAEERDTRLTGIPRAYSGLVYKEFQWDKHVGRVKEDRTPIPPVGWASWDHPPDNYTLRFAIDYHPQKNHHVLFIATSPWEYQFVYAELWIDCLMSELVVEINRILKGRTATVPGLIDPLASTPNRVTDITALDELLRLELPVVPATKDPYNGILAARALLKSRDRAGQAMLQVNPSLKRFLFEISRGYIWDEDTNKPKKKNDDAMENFYRLVLQDRLVYVEPSTAADYLPVAPRDLSNVIIRPNEFGFNTFEETTPRVARASRYRK